MSDIQNGTLVNDKYIIEGKLGEGGMGAIYKARDLNISRSVAIKFLGLRFSTDETIKKRFLKEARAAGKLVHQSIMAVYDAGEFDELLFIVMEFIDGHSIADEIRTNGPVSEQTAVQLSIAICEGLSEAHSQGIVHRDIKPSNIMLPQSADKFSLVKIVDFGLAQFDDQSETRLTRSGSVLGSPAYMSPEQCQGKDTDFRSDIYSLGCTLYEMLTGAPPFESDSPSALIIKHVTETPLSLREAAFLKGTTFSPGIEKIVKKMLSKRPSDRYQSVDLLSEALRNINSLDGASPDEDNGSDTAERKQRRLLVLVSSIAILAVICFFAVTRLQKNSSKITNAKQATISSTVLTDTSSPLPAVAHRGDDYIKQQKKLGTLPEIIDFSGKNLVEGYGDADFTDAGLKELSGTHTKGLHIPETEVTANGLVSIESLPLTELEIGGPSINDLALQHVARLTKLASLNLSHSAVTDSGINELIGLRKLNYLELDDTKVSNASQKAVSFMKELRGISVRRTKVSDEFVCAIAQTGRLQEAFLAETNVGDDGMECLSHSPEVTTLDLRRTKIVGKTLPDLAKLRNLSYLDLSYNTLDEARLVEFLEKKQKMAWLYLAGIKVTSATISALASMKMIHSVDLSDTDLNNSQLEQLAGNPSLVCVGVKNTHTTAGKQTELRLHHPQLEFKSKPPELVSFKSKLTTQNR